MGKGYTRRFAWLLFFILSAKVFAADHDLVQPEWELLEPPVFNFTGKGIKIEIEDMQLSGFTYLEDRNASAGVPASLDTDESVAECVITLPAGRYECMLRERAKKTERSAVTVRIGEKTTVVSPSNPPLGIWEFTLRTPVIFEIAEETTVPVVLTSQTPGMAVDYVQFVKLD